MAIDRKRAMSEIQANITNHGYHLYLISGGQAPRYAYTIGLRETRLRAEILLAGAALLTAHEVQQAIADVVKAVAGPTSASTTEVPSRFGAFTLREAHGSWAEKLMIGATDFYQSPTQLVYQAIPPGSMMSIDIPDTTIALGAQRGDAWQWIDAKWPFSVPGDSFALADLKVLRGLPITEAARWEANQWELFHEQPPEPDLAAIRAVSLGTLLAHDPSLAPVLDLRVGEALWRKERGEWNCW